MRECAEVVERRLAWIGGVDQDGAAAQGADQDVADGGIAGPGYFFDCSVRRGVELEELIDLGCVAGEDAGIYIWM